LSNVAKQSTDVGDGFNTELQRANTQELDNDVIVDFTNQIDSDYEESLAKLVGWSEVSSPLIPDE